MAAYRDAGYDFLALTDHRKVTSVAHAPEGLVAIPGIELDYVLSNQWVHLLGLGVSQEIEQRCHHDRCAGCGKHDIAPGQKIGLQEIKQGDGHECAVEAEQPGPHERSSDPEEHGGRRARGRADQNRNAE